MEEEKKNKLKKYGLIGLLALLVFVVVITSTILHFKKQRLDEIKKDNDKITEEVVLGD